MFFCSANEQSVLFIFGELIGWFQFSAKDSKQPKLFKIQKLAEAKGFWKKRSEIKMDGTFDSKYEFNAPKYIDFLQGDVDEDADKWFGKFI